MTSAGRWSLVALIAVLALVVAIWPRGGGEPERRDQGGTSVSAPQEQVRRAQDTREALAGPRAEAALEPCPVAEGNPSAPSPESPLVSSGLVLDCLADGAPVPLAEALAGKPAVVNIWAYWCAPCAKELPALAEYAAQVAGEITVLTVHRDAHELNALLKLAQYGVHLPGVQDGTGSFAAAVGAPNVLPVTVVLRADGTVARILPVAFTSAEEIARDVQEALGVAG